LTDELLSQYGHLHAHGGATNHAEAGESTRESPAIGEGNQDTEYGGQGKQEGESMDEDDQEQDERGAAEDAVEQPYRVWDDNDCNATDGEDPGDAVIAIVLASWVSELDRWCISDSR
jgi:hypothetical protein